MLEWVGLIVVVSLMNGVAEMEGQSGILWGGVTLLTCLLGMFVLPVPSVGVVIGGACGYLLMAAYKRVTEPD